MMEMTEIHLLSQFSKILVSHPKKETKKAKRKRRASVVGMSLPCPLSVISSMPMSITVIQHKISSFLPRSHLKLCLTRQSKTILCS